MGTKETDTHELLRNVPLLAELDDRELEGVARVAVPRKFPKGTRVFHQGDRSDACYVVKAGEVSVVREHTDGRSITLAAFGPGEVFGELAMLDGDERSASAEALADTELIALPASDVRRLIGESAPLGAKLVVALTRRLREANDRIARQSFQTVPSRVAGVLERMIAGESIQPGRDGITIRMRQADLAKHAGTSRESVSRFLATLERSNVVRVGRGRVTILEPERLRAYIY